MGADLHAHVREPPEVRRLEEIRPAQPLGDDEEGPPDSRLLQDRSDQVEMALLAVVESQADGPRRYVPAQGPLPAFLQREERAVALFHPANLAAELIP